ncbi:MAG: hypothetical protein IJY61_08830 [Candidatus Gastranaerophilales bacterium]|nr:hypothetical protein [Candidatus Gastranaerophilales bacterium]
MLENLGFKKRTHVGISLSANNFIELVCIDKTSKSVVKYSSGNIKYNNAIREIIDFDEFAEVLEGLFEDAGLNPSECAVTLNLPNVHFGITPAEGSADPMYIIDNLKDEIEELYIFKRNEPAISYAMLDSATRGQKNVVYGAVQTKVIGKIIEIFENIQADLVRIDTSYSSMLKALQFCDRFNQYTQKGEQTSVLLVTPNSCCAFYLHGSCVVDCIEEPLAVKSFSSEEVYSTIAKIASNALAKNSSSSLLIISETDEVNAEILSQRLDFAGTIDCINKSLNQNDKFIDVSGVGSDIDANMISYMTIEAVGAACANFDDYPLNLNFLPAELVNENIVQVAGREVDFFRFIMIVIGGAILIALILVAILHLGISSQKSSVDSKNTEYRGQIEVFERRISENKANTGKSVFPVLSEVLENNKSIVSIYTALSTDIPDNIYIKKFVTNSEGGIGILGEAETAESVQDFVKSLKEKEGDLMLSKLSVNSTTDLVPAKIPNGFTFEIKSSSSNVSLDYDSDFLPSANSMTTTRGNSGERREYAPPPSPVI